MPYGNVNCKFVSEFRSAGINQTVHKIFAVVDTKVTVVLPMNKLVCENNAEVLICESLIIGEIKTRIRQNKVFKQQPFGLFSILKVDGFVFAPKKKLVNGSWESTDELEVILEEYEVMKNS